jgi:hypothetical protein
MANNIETRSIGLRAVLVVEDDRPVIGTLKLLLAMECT